MGTLSLSQYQYRQQQHKWDFCSWDIAKHNMKTGEEQQNFLVNNMGQSEPKCVHCSLVTSHLSSSSSDSAMADMTTIITFLLPGVYFCILGVRWGVLLLCKWMREAKYHQYQDAGLPISPGQIARLQRRHFPWEGFVKIVLSVLACIATGSVNSSIMYSNILLINMYSFFFISGILDTVIFYHGYTTIPEGLQSFILSGCFGIESLCFYSIITPDTSHIILILLVIISILSIISLLETVIDNRLIKFCRSYFTILQGTWLIQISSLTSSSLSSSSWTSCLFNWHAAGLFLLSMILIVTCQYCSQQHHHHQYSHGHHGHQDAESGSQLVPCKMMRLPPASSFSSTTDMISAQSPKTPSVVDVEPWDNVQYQTHKIRS